MKRIIVDFDNTMGVAGCDVDDGLALLYLLGHADSCHVEALCTTYGNSTLETVYENTLRLAKEWNLDIPVFRGAPRADSEVSENEAARYMAEAVAASPGEISIMAIGSLTNLKHAAQLNPQFFEQVAQIGLMGGIESTLVITGDRIMNELNFSCDAAATYAVLSAGEKVTIATANKCLPAFFTKEMMQNQFGEDSWLCRTCAYWFGDMDARYLWHGWTCWDVVTAAMLLNPELFEDVVLPVTLNERMFAVGYLERAAENAPKAHVHTPVISDSPSFCQHVLEAWSRGLAVVGKN